MSLAADLDGLSILVTRAIHQSDTLCTLIERHSGDAVRCPVTVIEPPSEHRNLERDLAAVGHANIVIFVSPSLFAELRTIRRKGPKCTVRVHGADLPR